MLIQLASFPPDRFAYAARLEHSTAAELAEGKAPDSEALQSWLPFNGEKIHHIQISGLVRTKEFAILWLMQTREGQIFSAEQFGKDLQRLFNTGNVYDVKGLTTKAENANEGVDIQVILVDKWTLFPVIGAQGGGGSSTVGGGLYESNLLGYMINSSVLVWTFNGTNSFDINANQEYFRGSQAMWSLDWQDSISPEMLHRTDGTSLGQFAWRRQQKEIMIGTHLPGPVRLLFYGSIFQDSVFNNDGNFNITTPSGLQQKFYPKVIFGKSNWSNYLEEGTELTFQPTVANLIGNGPQYLAFEVDFKKVAVIGNHHNDNLAFYASASSMGNGGPNYIYNVGGYFNVRGFSDMREFGRRMFFTNIEYRPFLWSYRFNFWDLDLLAIQGCVFSDYGSAWGDSTLTGEAAAEGIHPLWSAGAGLRINMVKFAGFILRLDLAQTLNPSEGTGFSFGIGQFF